MYLDGPKNCDVDSIIMVFSPIDSHADDDVDTAGHEGVDERHHEMSLVSDDGHEAKKRGALVVSW